MKIQLQFALTAVALAFGISSHSALAEDEPASWVLSATYYEVKLGHTQKFRSGVSAWKDCYLENDGEGMWNTWYRMQDRVNTYVVTVIRNNWVDLMADDEAWQACDEIGRTEIIPHVSSANRSISHFLPEWSSSDEGQFDVAEVHYFRVNDPRAFQRLVSEIGQTIRGDEDLTPAFWYNVRGGRNGPHYLLVEAFADFADLDKERPGVWERYEAHRGAEATGQRRAEFGQALEEYWSAVYARVAELSHWPAD